MCLLSRCLHGVSDAVVLSTPFFCSTLERHLGQGPVNSAGLAGARLPISKTFQVSMTPLLPVWGLSFWHPGGIRFPRGRGSALAVPPAPLQSLHGHQDLWEEGDDHQGLETPALPLLRLQWATVISVLGFTRTGAEATLGDCHMRVSWRAVRD